LMTIRAMIDRWNGFDSTRVRTRSRAALMPTP
jgi:hypothetical protein